MSLPFNPQNYARDVEAKTARLFTNQKLLPIRLWVLAEQKSRVWLFAILEQQHYENLTQYCDPSLVRKLSDVLQTHVHIQDRKRYAILLGDKPALPRKIDFPAVISGDGFPFGVGLNGEVRMRPGNGENEFLHVIGAGTTGSGKSNFLLSLALTSYNQGWSLYLADPEGHTFNPDQWDNIAACPVILEPEGLDEAMARLWAELERRGSLYREQAAKNGGIMPRDLDEYNDHVSTANEMLPRLLFLLEEANSFINRNNVQEITRLTQRGRKWGLHIAMFAQNWRATDVPRPLSMLFGTRLCFRVDDDTSGQVVLNVPSWGKKAMRIRERGRAILFQRGQRYQYVQTYYLPEERALEVLRPHMKLPAVIEPWQVELVQYADRNLPGFIVNKLAAAFRDKFMAGDTNFGSWSIRNLAEDWERCGWLEPDRHATDCRKLTPELRRLAGLSVSENRDMPDSVSGGPETNIG